MIRVLVRSSNGELRECEAPVIKTSRSNSSSHSRRSQSSSSDSGRSRRSRSRSVNERRKRSRSRRGGRRPSNSPSTASTTSAEDNMDENTLSGDSMSDESYEKQASNSVVERKQPSQRAVEQESETHKSSRERLEVTNSRSRGQDSSENDDYLHSPVAGRRDNDPRQTSPVQGLEISSPTAPVSPIRDISNSPRKRNRSLSRDGLFNSRVSSRDRQASSYDDDTDKGVGTDQSESNDDDLKAEVRLSPVVAVNDRSKNLNVLKSKLEVPLVGAEEELVVDDGINLQGTTELYSDEESVGSMEGFEIIAPDQSNMEDSVETMTSQDLHDDMPIRPQEMSEGEDEEENEPVVQERSGPVPQSIPRMPSYASRGATVTSEITNPSFENEGRVMDNNSGHVRDETDPRILARTQSQQAQKKRPSVDSRANQSYDCRTNESSHDNTLQHDSFHGETTNGGENQVSTEKSTAKKPVGILRPSSHGSRASHGLSNDRKEASNPIESLPTSTSAQPADPSQVAKAPRKKPVGILRQSSFKPKNIVTKAPAAAASVLAPVPSATSAQKVPAPKTQKPVGILRQSKFTPVVNNSLHAPSAHSEEIPPESLDDRRCTDPGEKDDGSLTLGDSSKDSDYSVESMTVLDSGDDGDSVTIIDSVYKDSVASDEIKDERVSPPPERVEEQNPTVSGEDEKDDGDSSVAFDSDEDVSITVVEDADGKITLSVRKVNLETTIDNQQLTTPAAPQTAPYSPYSRVQNESENEIDTPFDENENGINDPRKDIMNTIEAPDCNDCTDSSDSSRLWTSSYLFSHENKPVLEEVDFGSSKRRNETEETKDLAHAFDQEVVQEETQEALPPTKLEEDGPIPQKEKECARQEHNTSIRSSVSYEKEEHHSKDRSHNSSSRSSLKVESSDKDFAKDHNSSSRSSPKSDKSEKDKSKHSHTKKSKSSRHHRSHRSSSSLKVGDNSFNDTDDDLNAKYVSYSKSSKTKKRRDSSSSPDKRAKRHGKKEKEEKDRVEEKRSRSRTGSSGRSRSKKEEKHDSSTLVKKPKRSSKKDHIDGETSRSRSRSKHGRDEKVKKSKHESSTSLEKSPKKTTSPSRKHKDKDRSTSDSKPSRSSSRTKRDKSRSSSRSKKDKTNEDLARSNEKSKRKEKEAVSTRPKAEKAKDQKPRSRPVANDDDSTSSASSSEARPVQTKKASLVPFQSLEVFEEQRKDVGLRKLMTSKTVDKSYIAVRAVEGRKLVLFHEKFYLPESMRFKAMQHYQKKYPNSALHFISRNFFWPYMEDDVQRFKSGKRYGTWKFEVRQE